MTRANLASLTLALVATLGSTGCGHRRYYARYAYAPVRVHAPVYVRAAPPAPPPPQVEMAPAPVYAGGPRPIVVYANAPGTTVIVINPAPGGPPIVQQVGPAPGREGWYPQAQPAPVPQPQVQPQGNPNAWFEEE
jgi:hypothetical protein